MTEFVYLDSLSQTAAVRHDHLFGKHVNFDY